MKMTMHIDEDVLAQVMELTGAKTKTQAVEMALTEMARRHKQKKFFQKGLGLTPEELGEYGQAVMAAQTDPMDTDEAAVQRFIARSDELRAAKQARELKVAEEHQGGAAGAPVETKGFPVQRNLPRNDPLPKITYPKTQANEQSGPGR